MMECIRHLHHQRNQRNNMDTKLKKLKREPEFWLLLVVSLPGLVTVARAILDGEQIDLNALAALPILVYLGIGRQVARGGAALGAGHQLAMHAIMPPVNPDEDPELTHEDLREAAEAAHEEQS